MKEYKVTVSRQSIDSVTFPVTAPDEETAKERALDLASNYEFGSGNAEYEAQIINSVAATGTANSTDSKEDVSLTGKIIAIDNILKVLDVNGYSLSDETITALKAHGPTYRDWVLKEDLFDLNQVMESEEDAEQSFAEVVKSEFDILAKLMSTSESAYLRLVYH